MFYPALLIAIFSFNYYRLSAGDIFFTSIEVGVLSCLKHNLLSSPKINILNSFLMIYSSRRVGRICSYFITKIPSDYANPMYLYTYTHIFILTYLNISIYPYIVTLAIHLFFGIFNHSKYNREAMEHFNG